MLKTWTNLSHLPGKKGELKLRLGLKDGLTIIKSAYNQVPLKVAKPFYLEPETGEIFIYQMNPAGGMVQGDNYYLEIDLEKGARAFFTTQSASKIYRAPESYAYQSNFFRLEEDAVLEYFPDPVIPFAGARFIGETEVHLTRGSTAFVSEVVTPGRVAHGEVFQYESYQSKTKVYWDGDLILWDNWRLAPKKTDLRSLALYDGFTHQGNLFLFSEKITQLLLDQLQKFLHDQSGLLASASLTMKNGITVRILGYRAVDVEKVIMSCWNIARQSLLGLPKPSIRKY